MSTFQRTQVPGAKGYSPPSEMRSKVWGRILAVGEARAAKELSINRLTLARLVAGFPMSHSSLVAIGAVLSEVTKSANAKQLTLDLGAK